MKISVRTLIALSDPACEPEFRKLLEKRIPTRENQEELEQFIHRVRKIIGLPLRAPELVDGSEELDPNIVAEYLDHQLSVEEESHFESLFLSSDVFLAELASISSILNQSLGQVVEISDEFRMRLYEIASQTPLPKPTSSFSPEKSEDQEKVCEKYAQKSLQECLEEWKWERLNHFKNIVVASIFLATALFVWSNPDMLHRFAQKFQTPESTVDLHVSSGETMIPIQSALESVEWNETPGGWPSYSQLEKPESILEKTDPKPLNSHLNPPSLPPLFSDSQIRPVSL